MYMYLCRSFQPPRLLQASLKSQPNLTMRGSDLQTVEVFLALVLLYPPASQVKDKVWFSLRSRAREDEHA